MTHLTQLGLPKTTIARLNAGGIHSVEYLGHTAISRLHQTKGLSPTCVARIQQAYKLWFARNICPDIPPLSDDWQPPTHRGNV